MKTRTPAHRQHPNDSKVMEEVDQKFAQAAEETKRRLPTPTAEEEKEIQDAYARQEMELQKPALADRQKAALNARAQSRFGVDATFTDAFPTLKKDMVVPIVLRYTTGFTPPNPSWRDVKQQIAGGYPQQCVELTLAKVTDDFHSGRQVEVEFERSVCMSYQNGSRELTNFYALHNDGTIKYLDHEGYFRELIYHVPRWEFANLSMVAPICIGVDL
jgi:hypothetical protein